MDTGLVDLIENKTYLDWIMKSASLKSKTGIAGFG